MEERRVGIVVGAIRGIEVDQENDMGVVGRVELEACGGGYSGI